MKFRKDLIYLFLLLGMGIIFWGEALAPGKLFFYGDIPMAIVSKKLFWSGSGYPTLWSPYFFFGVPYAANPQFEAFYPLNFFFLLFGPERGVVYDVVLHHLFFLLTFYLALRKVGFREEASLIAAAGFGKPRARSLLWHLESIMSAAFSLNIVGKRIYLPSPWQRNRSGGA